MFTTYIIVALIAYLLGSIPFGYILVRVFRKQDIRETGSGNIGATNVARTGAKGLAIATLLLDAGKGLLAVCLAAWLAAWLVPTAVRSPQTPRLVSPYGSSDELSWLFGLEARQALERVQAVAALFVVIGHILPIWLKFRGGKGVATAVGAFGLLAPHALGIALIAFVIQLAVFRYVSLASMSAALLFPVFAYFFDGYGVWNPAAIWMMVTACVLIIARHYSNIRRMLAGTEPRLGSKPAPPPEQLEKQI